MIVHCTITICIIWYWSFRIKTKCCLAEKFCVSDEQCLWPALNTSMWTQWLLSIAPVAINVCVTEEFEGLNSIVSYIKCTRHILDINTLRETRHTDEISDGIMNTHTSTNQFQNGCMTYLLTGLVSTELYCIPQTTNSRSVGKELHNTSSSRKTLFCSPRFQVDIQKE